MKKIISGLIWIYQGTFSPLLRILFGQGCRFQPSCSEYARESIEKYGVFQGIFLTARRLSRCHPFN